MKIFQLGLPRTGITSLTEALKILGFNAKKYSIGGLENGLPKREVIDKCDAITDTPIVQHYRMLLEFYPDCKFIVTIRDLGSWLKSCSQWFQPGKPGDAQDYYEVHRNIIGSIYYHDIIFIESYFRYYNNLFYFLNHASDVQDIEGNRFRILYLEAPSWSKWERLCSFLDREIPTLPYPHENRSEK